MSWLPEPDRKVEPYFVERRACSCARTERRRYVPPCRLYGGPKPSTIWSSSTCDLWSSRRLLFCVGLGKTQDDGYGFVSSMNRRCGLMSSAEVRTKSECAG